MLRGFEWLLEQHPARWLGTLSGGAVDMQSWADSALWHAVLNLCIPSKQG